MARDMTLFPLSSFAVTSPLAIVATFDGTDGQNPFAGLTEDSAGNFYGTTSAGGANNDGTIFEITARKHKLKTLANFKASTGGNVECTLFRDSAGNLYGTSPSGGTNGDGTVFELPAGKHKVAILADLDSSTGSDSFSGVTMDANGNLYGTTSGGGANNFGWVFEVAAGTHALTTLASFAADTANDSLWNLVLDRQGNLYGTSYSGGVGYAGTVFEVAAGTHILSTLANFHNEAGAFPKCDLIFDSAGNLYGTTAPFGKTQGMVFEVIAGTHAFKTLATFSDTAGVGPYGGLLMDARGDLFGSTDGFGTIQTNFGTTVFEVVAGTHTLKTLATIYGSVYSQSANGDLVADVAGNLYGTTTYGGGTTTAPSS